MTGRTDLVVELKRDNTQQPINGTLPIIVTRPQRVIDSIFTSSVAIFVSIFILNILIYYINSYLYVKVLNGVLNSNI